MKTSEDENLAQWLEETAPVPAADTTTLDPTQTIALSAGKSAAPRPEEAPAEPADEEPLEEEQETTKAQVVGTFSGSRKTEAASSRDAASQGLKNLLRHFG